MRRTVGTTTSRGSDRRRGLRRGGTLAFGLLLLTAPIAIAAEDSVRFAVIGDFGDDPGGHEGDVAAMLKDWQPDLIITTGDNNYPLGEAKTIDENIGKHYHEFIAPYRGRYGAGATENRFFPSLGNHDWGNGNNQAAHHAKPYLDWLELPGNERYYDFVRGPVHFFAIDSDAHEPDGVSADSKQAKWLKERLGAAKEPWKVVYFHHPPYTSGTRHGPCAWMRWPFEAWGASVVLAGHEHSYERLDVRSRSDLAAMPLFIVGTGGAESSAFAGAKDRDPGSRKRIEGFGALSVTATDREITFEYFEVGKPSAVPSDRFTMSREPSKTAHPRS